MCNEYLKSVGMDCSACPFFEPEASCIYTKVEFVNWLKGIIEGKILMR